MMTAKLRSRIKEMERLCKIHKKKNGKNHGIWPAVVCSLRPCYKGHYKHGLKRILFYLKSNEINDNLQRAIKREI